MPVTSFLDYVRFIEDTLYNIVETGEATSKNIQVDQRSSLRGYIGGILEFSNGSELHFKEFVDVTQSEPRLMYAYHYQDVNKQLVFRYDNASHRPALAQPEHKHTPNSIELAIAPNLAQIIDKILQV